MNGPEKRVLVGMSGGIDSTATCLMLREQGYEIVGGDEPVEARRLAESMGIEHHVADEREDFRRTIVQYFIDEYRAGRTPNPCVMCNPLFKFRILTEWADRLGCAYIATGHYTRIEEQNGKRYIVAGDDDKKDQSYFLWRLGQDVLRRCLFPLGEYTKLKVRDYLRNKGYTLKADEGESMEVCFIKGDYRDFLREYSPEIDTEVGKGWFVNAEGVKLGEHKGFPYYTIDSLGQAGLRAENQSAEEHRDARRRRTAEDALHVGRAGLPDGRGGGIRKRQPDGAHSLPQPSHSLHGEPSGGRTPAGALRGRGIGHRTRPVGGVLHRPSRGGRSVHRFATGNWNVC